MSKKANQNYAAQENRQYLQFAWCPGTNADYKRRRKLAKQAKKYGKEVLA